MKKTTITAFVFLCFWCHYIYLGQWGKQILFWVTLGGFGVWWWIDLFTLGSKVKAYNLQLQMDEMREINSQTTQMMQASAATQMASTLHNNQNTETNKIEA